jgi:hypothetical protein
MAETPTRDQVLIERHDIESTIAQNDANLDLDDYISKALAHVKRDLREVKGIKWDMVYDSTNSQYFENTDGDANNDDTIKHMITLVAISFAFKDLSIRVEDSNFWDLYINYREDYDRALNQAKLDIDWNESGGITEDEDGQTTQVFFRA